MDTLTLAPYFHFAVPGIIIGVSAIANAIGQGIAAGAGLRAINTQPNSKEDISDTLILGLALIETSGVLCFITCFYVFKGWSTLLFTNPYPCYAEIGIGILFLLTAGPVGIISGFPVKGACESISRQPFFAGKIKTLMLLTQTFLQAPIIFAFLLVIFAKPLLMQVTSSGQALQIISSGLALGIGSIGPIIGLGIFTTSLCHHIGRNREAYRSLLFFTFASEAIISSSIIFAFIVAFFILKMEYTAFHEALSGIHFLSAALAIGLSTLGVGISSGRISAQGVEEITNNPERSSAILKICLLSQALIETCTLYGLTIAFMILFM
jgi:F-type H+-transporting ATPase subunit c